MFTDNLADDIRVGAQSSKCCLLFFSVLFPISFQLLLIAFYNIHEISNYFFGLIGESFFSARRYFE